MFKIQCFFRTTKLLFIKRNTYNTFYTICTQQSWNWIRNITFSSTYSSVWNIIVTKRFTTKSVLRNPLVCNFVCQYARFGQTPNRGFVHCNNPWNIGNETPRLKSLAYWQWGKYIFCNNEVFPFGLYVVPVLIFFSIDSRILLSDKRGYEYKKKTIIYCPINKSSGSFEQRYKFILN